jgi:trans-2,3-dihydro-3-hydroxyanthranilate isomerase
VLTLRAPLRYESALARVRADREAIRRLEDDSFNCYLAWTDLAAGRTRARMFPSPPAEAEDAATGSAAAPLLAYLHEREGLERLDVLQGVEMLRPSRLRAELENGRVRVSGDVLVLITGSIRLP